MVIFNMPFQSASMSGFGMAFDPFYLPINAFRRFDEVVFIVGDTG